IMYWNVFAGGFGQTYGCHDVWQMYKLDKEGINQPLRPWPVALDLPMANQVKHLKNLMLSRPFLSRIPDQSIVVADQAENNDYVIATRDESGSYAMVFFPTGKATMLDLSPLSAKKFNTWWYDTRTGVAFDGPTIAKKGKVMVQPPSSGKGQDWVLVLDDKKSGFGVPGVN
ncbi:MAG: putative collagen-binding domain-containing protein, partial [Bacteroidota bacterium]